MHNQMIKTLDKIYLAQVQKSDAIFQIHVNPHYAHFGKMDKQKENVEQVKKEYNQKMNDLYNDLNEYRIKLKLKPLTNPYEERN